MSEEKKELVAEEICDCPFCGKKVSKSLDEHGEVDGIIHVMPICEQFQKMEPDKFISAILKETLKQMGN